MISSMTGYGRGEMSADGITSTVEVRSVNSRFMEIVVHLPRSIAMKENAVKEIVRSKFSRGKINIGISITYDSALEVPVKINTSAARAYFKLLNDLRKAVKIQERVKLEHLMNFSEIFKLDEQTSAEEDEWRVVEKSLNKALDEVVIMRQNEGIELVKDLSKRIDGFEEAIVSIEHLAESGKSEERLRLHERLQELIGDKKIVDEGRLEQEVALLIDKLDITEECVRLKSHIKFFREALNSQEAAGRKLTFLVQEINREANTISSKSNSAEIAHMVVAIKEDLEKIREQLQNIE